MGTSWSLRFDNPAQLPLDAVRAAVEAALGRVIAQMSTWEPDSDISRFARADAGSCHRIAPEFAEVLGCALRWAEASAGAIDPSIGALVGLWGFGAHAVSAPGLPAAHAVAAARSRTGWQRLRFDGASRTIVQPGGMALDLSAVAKGFAVDHASEALRALGLSNFLLEIGGELRAFGHRPGGRHWQVQIEAAPGVRASVGLSDMAIATSGDHWQRRAHGERHWSHTIDPRSGEPAMAGLAAVSVLHPSCMEADALATVLAVLGPLDGAAFADRHRIAALFHARDAGGGMLAQPSAAWAGAADPR